MSGKVNVSHYKKFILPLCTVDDTIMKHICKVKTSN